MNRLIQRLPALALRAFCLNAQAHVTLATVYYRLNRKLDGDRERAPVQKLNAQAQSRQQQGVNGK